MDEDIDIEEHDVLDNPKIRDIFPDLSLVKIEPPETDVQDQFEESTKYQDCAFNVKTEILSDDDSEFGSYDPNGESMCKTCDSGGSTENVDHVQNDNEKQNEPDTELNDVDEDDRQPNNRIIFGTIPTNTLEYDRLYEEALRSYPTVYLENWAMKLYDNPCYCHMCEILFPTVNCLDAHKSVNHSLLVALDTADVREIKNTARKSTVKSTHCNHCNKTFPDGTALIKHLYKLLPVDDFNALNLPPPQPVKIEARSIQYKCIKCKSYFRTLLDGRKHKKMCHPDYKSGNIICKVHRIQQPQVSANSELDTQRFRSHGKLIANSSLVPKSVIFQCNKCMVGFLSCYSAAQHSKTCENTTEYHKCLTCKLKIRCNDYQTHEWQHKYCNKLKMYKLNKRLYERVTLKCPSCCICFDEKLFWRHRRECNGVKGEFQHCEICSVDITKSRYQDHSTKHMTKNYTKKDFILVEFYDLNSKPDENRQIGNTLFHCNVCGSYKTIGSLRGHKNGACKHLKVKFCDICGLGFGKIHYNLHRATHANLKLTLKDYDIISLSTGKKVDPPMPQFHRCQKCKIHFLFKQNVANHNCNAEKYVTCKICNQRYNLKAFPPHSKFHDFKGDAVKHFDDMPELLKMYNSINSMWDIVYMCMECSIITVTYDSAVEHSQDHICSHDSSVYNACDKCQFNIFEKDYQMHLSLHKNNSSINRKTFRILKFNYKDMYKKKWMNIFLPLSIQNKRQILAKSIYRCTRRFKLNCEIYCRTDDIKFYCMKCKTNVDIKDMKKHYFDVQCKYSSKYGCNSCELSFKSLSECVTHENEHEDVRKSYKVYSFNDQADEEFNRRLLEFDCGKDNKTVAKCSVTSKIIKKPIGKYRTVATNRTKMVASKSKFKLYKCTKCQSCVCIDKNVTIHKCSAIKKSHCNICNNYFYPRILSKHLEMHRYYGRKPSVIYFNPTSVSTSKAAVYKCDCGLHFTSKQSIENHLIVCDDDLDVSKETCSKCHLLFPTDVLVTHLCKHHSKSVNISVDIVEVSKEGKFKCVVCNVIYLNMINFERHLFECQIKVGRKCKQCRLMHDDVTFTDHICDSEQPFVVSKKSVSTCILYKCEDCDLHYFNSKGLKYHTEQNHVNHRQCVACDTCKLRFTGIGIQKHVSLHDSSQNQYMIKIFDGTGSYRILKGYNTKPVNNINNNTMSNDDSIEKELQASNVDMEKGSKENVSVINSDQTVDDNTTSSSKVYRCLQCDLCYLYRKSWNYHIEMKHVNRRAAVACQICGLKFTKNSLLNHAPTHVGPEHYTIQVFDMDTGDTTIIQGKNLEVITNKPDIKRSSQFEGNSPLRMKTRKLDDINTTVIGDTQEASTSKTEFESAHMSPDEQEMTSSDSDSESTDDDWDSGAGPSDYSSALLFSNAVENEVINKQRKSFTNEIVLSKKMKEMLCTNLDNYTNILYKCVHCNICYLTKMSCVSHFRRVDHTKEAIFVNCDLCELPFTAQTLPRHKVIHHEKMNIDLKSLKIVSVTKEYNTYKKISTLDESETDDTSEVNDNDAIEMNVDDDNISMDSVEMTTQENISDANMDDVKMDIDEDIPKDTIYYGESTDDSVNENLKNNTMETNITQRAIVDDNTDKENMNDIKSEAKINYYKCAVCNVCFVDDNVCREHCISHKTIDKKLLYECNICNFNFLVDNLLKHMTTQHDTEFRLEDLIVTEYTPTADNVKIDTYRGIDKVQSRLVSTTTDLTTDNVKTVMPVANKHDS